MNSCTEEDVELVIPSIIRATEGYLVIFKNFSNVVNSNDIKKIGYYKDPTEEKQIGFKR